MPDDVFIVYGAKGCSYCTSALDLLEKTGLPYRYIPLDQRQEELDWFLLEGYKTIPQIFYKEVHLGGYTDLKNYVKGLKQ